MTLHADAVRVLTGWSAPDERQHRLRERYLAHLAAHPDAMWRRCRPGHLTASAAVVDAAGGAVLLTLHPKVGRWVQLGGHCEETDPDLAAAVLREATEESGIEGLRVVGGPLALDRHPVTCLPGGSWHLDVQYLVVAPPGARPVRSPESLDLRWFPPAALPEPADQALRRLVASATTALGA